MILFIILITVIITFSHSVVNIIKLCIAEENEGNSLKSAIEDSCKGEKR